MDVDATVAGFGWMAQHASDGLADGGEASSAKEFVPAVEIVDVLGSRVGDQTGLQIPVEEGAIENERVAQPAGVGFLLQGFLHRDFIGVDGQRAGSRMARVGAKLGRDEALDARAAVVGRAVCGGLGSR